MKEMETKEGIKLDKTNIESNPGKTSVAKLLLNTLWGKFGQNENLGKTEAINDPKQLFDMLTNPDIEINSWLPVNEDVIYIGWSHRKQAARVTGLTNVVMAAYTTAQARLKLYSYYRLWVNAVRILIQILWRSIQQVVQESTNRLLVHCSVTWRANY